MKNLTLLIISCAISTFSLGQSADQATNQPASQLAPHVADELIVEFSDNAWLEYESAEELFEQQPLKGLLNTYGLESHKLTGNKQEPKTFVLHFNNNLNVEQAIEVISQTGLFRYVEPNYIAEGAGKRMIQTIPSDLLFSRQWGLYNDGTFSASPAVADADVDMELAWDIQTGSSTIVLCVLDAGFNMDHPELSGRMWSNSGESQDGQDSDNNGYIDDYQGWDFINNDNDPTDDHGHGTNVAGIATATGNNGVGYAGIDWNCKLMVGKVLGANNSGSYSAIANGIYYAVDNGAHVINMSVGGAGGSTLLSDAVDYADQNGVAIIACMMNENNQVSYYPAAYPSTIAVGSTDANDERSAPFFWSSTSGSCFGNHIDVVAPGNYIYGLHYLYDSNYNTYWGGTSQATPLVAGICSLLMAQDPTRTPADLRTILRATAEDQVGDATEDTPGFDIYYGYGRVNAHQALLYNGVSLQENAVSTLRCYPNPTTDQLTVQSETTISSISVWNTVGQEVLTLQEVNSRTATLDLQAQPTGMYLVKVQTVGGEIIEKVVVED